MNTKETVQSGSKTRFNPDHGFTPILRWAGSKKRSLAEIVPFLPKCSDRYLEVFAGSACLFFHVAPKRAVIADNNVELIRFYKTVAKHPENVFNTFSEIDRDPKTYYKVRSELHPVPKTPS
jgi:DNA adenine methylase